MLELGAAFAECPGTLRRAGQLGLTGWAFSVAGRAGALGDVRADTAAAVLGFIAPEAVRDGWDAARKVAAPAQIAAQHRQECCRWGRERLDPLPGVQRLVDLAERVVLAADGAGLPLFAAWRAMPMPEDGPGARAAVLAHLLREYQQGAYLAAVRVVGLTPLAAVLAGGQGESAAIAAGWLPPFPPREPLLRRRIWAEVLADRMVGAGLRVLGRAERVELVTLLAAAVQAARTVTVELPPVL